MWSSRRENQNFLSLRIAPFLFRISFVVWKCVNVCVCVCVWIHFEPSNDLPTLLVYDLKCYSSALAMCVKVCDDVLCECNVHACMYTCAHKLCKSVGCYVFMCVVCLQRCILLAVICCRLLFCHVDGYGNQIKTHLNCPVRALSQIFERKHECAWDFRSVFLCTIQHVHSPLLGLLMDKFCWQSAGLVWVGRKISWRESNLTNLKLTLASQIITWFGFTLLCASLRG